MRIFVNKWMFAAVGLFIVSVGIYQRSGLGEKKQQVQKISTEVHDSVLSNRVFTQPSINLGSAPVDAIDSRSIAQKLQSLSSEGLTERKQSIQKEMQEGRLIERFNQHRLKPEEVLKLRRLALESSLITVRLYELN